MESLVLSASTCIVVLVNAIYITHKLAEKLYVIIVCVTVAAVWQFKLKMNLYKSLWSSELRNILFKAILLFLKQTMRFTKRDDAWLKIKCLPCFNVLMIYYH